MKKKKVLIRVLIFSIIAACFVQAGVLSNAATGTGDFNNDGVINMTDVMTLAGIFNSVSGDSRYVASYDLDSDGAINMADVMIVAGNFNKTVTAATSTVNTSSTPTVSTTPIPTVNATTQIDDWNYYSETTSISIKKVQTGSGSSICTYFVADIKLSGDAAILSAFANNKYQTIYSSTNAEVLSKMAQENNAIFAINGDFYSYRKDGYEIRNGILYRDIPSGDALILYKNGLMKTASESDVSASTLLSDGAFQVLSFGPALPDSSWPIYVPYTNVPSELDPDNYLSQRSPRTGIGMIEPNHFIFIVVDGRSSGYSAGMSLPEFSKTFADLGCKTAYNLDGGGSAEMYFDGKVLNKVNGTGSEHPLCDALYIEK